MSRPNLSIDDLAARLEGVKRLGHNQGQARCPAHDDSDPSMTFREGKTCIIMHCFAGCTFDDICRALDIEPSQLMYETIDRGDGVKLTRKPFWQREAEHMQKLNLQIGGEA